MFHGRNWDLFVTDRIGNQSLCTPFCYDTEHKSKPPQTRQLVITESNNWRTALGFTWRSVFCFSPKIKAETPRASGANTKTWTAQEESWCAQNDSDAIMRGVWSVLPWRQFPWCKNGYEKNHPSTAWSSFFISQTTCCILGEHLCLTAGPVQQNNYEWEGGGAFIAVR